MKVASVSADLLIKLALVALAAGLVIYGLRRASAAVADLVSKIPDLPEAYNPASSNNVVYGGVNSVGGALVSDAGPGRNADGSWNLGAFLYDISHPDPVGPRVTGSPNAWGTEGRARVSSPSPEPKDKFIDYSQTSNWGAA